MCKCCDASEVVLVRIWMFQVSGSAKCVVLLGVGQPGKDAVSVMLLVTRFPTTSPWVLWDGRSLCHAVLVLLLVALAIVMFHPGILALEVCPFRGQELAPALVETRPKRRSKQVNCSKPRAFPNGS